MIIGIEGVSCVGKSSLAAELADRLGRTTVVPCYFHSVLDPHMLPPIVAGTPGEQIAGLRRLLEVETVRRTRALAAQAHGRTVVLDRTVDTLLAHTVAVSALMDFGIEFAARRLVDRHVVVVPDITLLLTAPFEVRQGRAKWRQAMPELLYARDFTDHFLSYFRDPIAPVCVRLDASRPLAELALHAVAVLRNRAGRETLVSSHREPV